MQTKWWPARRERYSIELVFPADVGSSMSPGKRRVQTTQGLWAWTERKEWGYNYPWDQEGEVDASSWSNCQPSTLYCHYRSLMQDIPQNLPRWGYHWSSVAACVRSSVPDHQGWAVSSASHTFNQESVYLMPGPRARQRARRSTGKRG